MQGVYGKNDFFTDFSRKTPFYSFSGNTHDFFLWVLAEKMILLILAGKHDFTVLVETHTISFNDWKHDFWFWLENVILQFLTGNTQFFLTGKRGFLVLVGEHKIFGFDENFQFLAEKWNFKVLTEIAILWFWRENKILRFLGWNYFNYKIYRNGQV